MMDFFKWWYTDSSGNPYMTFSECALGHDLIIQATMIVSIAVMFIYLRIGINAYRKAKTYPKSLTKSYLLNKMNVFVLCGVSGYGYTVLSVYYNPYKLRLLLLIILAIYSYKFYKSIVKTNIIENILKREKAVEQKIKQYNKIAMKFQDSQSQSVDWITLKAFKMHGWIMINKIKFVKVSENDDEMVFLTEMEPHSNFGEHSHDCIEHIEVLDGELIDDMNDVRLIKGDKYIYGPNTVHAPYSTIESSYKVTFKKVIT